MRVVVQKVKYASCKVDAQITGAIKEGLLLFVGFKEDDTQDILKKMIHKILNLRIFIDENDKMNLSLLQVGGDILSISQFTLYANCKKGNRPSFIEAAKPVVSKPLYDEFNALLEEQGIHVEKGIFGADMKIELLNDGPITICLDSEELF